jgi:ketosteroid isomerase-like protein
MIEIVRTAIDAFNRRDMEAMIALGGIDEFEYDWTRSEGPLSGIYRGADGFNEFIDDQWSTFEEMRIEVREIVPCGDHVVVTAVTHARGREGVTGTARSAHLYTFKNDRIVRITLFQETDEALAAARE